MPLKPASWRHKSTRNMMLLSLAVEPPPTSPYFALFCSQLPTTTPAIPLLLHSVCWMQIPEKAITKPMASQAISLRCTWPRFFPSLTAKPITSIVWQRLRIWVLLQCCSLQNNAFIPTPSAYFRSLFFKTFYCLFCFSTKLHFFLQFTHIFHTLFPVSLFKAHLKTHTWCKILHTESALAAGLRYGFLLSNASAPNACIPHLNNSPSNPRFAK